MEVILPPKTYNLPEYPITNLSDADRAINEMKRRYDEVYNLLRNYVENGLSKVEIISPIERIDGEACVAVCVQDQVTPPLTIPFYLQTNTAALTSNTAVDDMAITISNTTGFVDEGEIRILNIANNRFFIGKQVGAVAGNVVTIDRPMDFAYQIGDQVATGPVNMAVDGSVTPQIFRLRSTGSEIPAVGDLTRILFHITDGSAMDDSLFGGIAALTNGVTLRRVDGEIRNLVNFKSNGELANVSFDLTYADRAPAGAFGLRARLTYAGQEKHGVAIRIGPDENLEIIINDNLTGLSSFTAIAEGHVVQTQEA